MINQILINILLPLLSSTFSPANIVVEEPEVQSICYVSPAHCDKGLTDGNTAG